LYSLGQYDYRAPVSLVAPIRLLAGRATVELS
jgi:hypothetical protein